AKVNPCIIKKIIIMVGTVFAVKTAMGTATMGNTKTFRFKYMALIRDKHSMAVMNNAIASIDIRVMVMAVAMMDTKASHTQARTLEMDNPKVCRTKERARKAKGKHRPNLEVMDLIKEERIKWMTI
ncbi:hypothetical protein BGX34_005550, partial [Mortierella sp. NVP85]